MRTYLFHEPVLLSSIKPTVTQVLCLGDAQLNKRTTSVQNNLLFRSNMEIENRRASKPKKKSNKFAGKVKIS